mgnify:CR=1 FL=1
MGAPGGPTTMAPGATSDQFFRLRVDEFQPGVIRSRSDLLGLWRARYYSPFVGGSYVGSNVLSDLDQPMEKMFPVAPGSGQDRSSIFLEDAGDWDSFDPDTFVPDDDAITNEAITAKRLRIPWTNSYTLSTVRGDTQLSAITITGAKRYINVARVDSHGTRGRLTYSITAVGTTRIVRWWAGTRLVAEGSRVGNGAVTCVEINSSGLSVACTLTYTADLDPGVAELDVRFPKTYPIHFSTGALAFPRTPEATVKDNGQDDYLYLSPVVAPGSYNYSVLQSDDNGVVQTAGIPAPAALVVNTVPITPTITGVTGTAAAMTVAWTLNAESGATYKVYASLVNGPINFGDHASPAVITTGVDAVSQVLAAIAGYAPADNTATIATMKNTIDAQIALANADFIVTQAAFNATWPGVVTAVQSAIRAYQLTIGVNAEPFVTQWREIAAGVTALVSSLPTSGLTLAQWQDLIGATYARALGMLGTLVDGATGKYPLPNGALLGAGSPSAALGTGSAIDGTAARSGGVGLTLEDLGTPVIVAGRVAICVRAVKGGIEERGNAVYVVEFDAAGAIVAARPVAATIQQITVTAGLTVSITADVEEIDSDAVATTLDIYVVAIAAAIVPGTPTNSGALTEIMPALKRATVATTAAGTGWYRVGAAGRSAAGGRSMVIEEFLVYLDSTAPGAVTLGTARVIRGG